MTDRYGHWFDTGEGMGRVTGNNRTRFFIKGEDAFGDIGETMENLASRQAEAYFLGWAFYRDAILRPKDPPPLFSLSTVSEHLRFFDDRLGSARAMLWDNSIMPNSGGSPDAVRYINGLRHGKAILDRRTPLAGTHHQKLQAFVAGPRSSTPGAATAYCGGMDMNKDRIGRNGLHDVHCKVRGDGANDLIDVFAERWNDHPDHGNDKLVPSYRPMGPKNGTDLVQVCRTYPMFTPLERGLTTLLKDHRDTLDKFLRSGNRPRPGDMRANGDTRLYDFYDTSKGVRQVGRAVKRAISEAKKYIYLEEQYLVHKWIGQVLAEKLKHANKDFRLVILISHPDTVSDLAQCWQRRREVIDLLRAADPAQTQWRLLYRHPKRPNAYVHSKTWIFDDELVITGSANADRRGYSYSSEVDVVVAGDLTGARRTAYGATTVAQDLRCRLFAKHLGGSPHFYLNPKQAITRWFAPGGNSDVVFYDPAAKTEDPDKNAEELKDAAKENSGAAAVKGLMERTSGTVENFLWDYFEDPHPDVPNP